MPRLGWWVGALLAGALGGCFGSTTSSSPTLDGGSIPAPDGGTVAPGIDAGDAARGLDASDASDAADAAGGLDANDAGTSATDTGVDALAPATLTLGIPTGSFADQQAGTTGGTEVFTVTNTGGVATGDVAVALSALSTPGDFAIVADTCSGAPLASAGTCQISVQFQPPAGVVGVETGTLQVSATPGGSPTAPLSATAYTPAVLTLLPPNGFKNFGTVAVPGNSSTFTFTLSNSGSQASGTPTITTDNALFTIAKNNCTGPVGATPCSFDVTFTPVAPGGQTVTITAAASPGGPATYGPTTGTGTGAVLTVTPGGWDTSFAACGTQTTDFTITNTGNVATTSALSLTFAGAQVGAFSNGSYSCTGPLPPATPCTIPVSFACPTTAPDGYEGKGTLTIAASGAASAVATLDVGAGLAISPDIAAFGSAVAPGAKATQLFTITNFTGATTKVITTLVTTGAFASQYVPADVNCVGNTLAANGTCTFNVTFTAPATGAAGVEDATLDVHCPQPPVCTNACTCIQASTELDATVQ